MKEELKKELQNFIDHLEKEGISLAEEIDYKRPMELGDDMLGPACCKRIDKAIDSFIDRKFPKMTKEEEIAETHKRG